MVDLLWDVDLVDNRTPPTGEGDGLVGPVGMDDIEEATVDLLHVYTMARGVRLRR
jgi:hypothetical protein